MILHLRSFFFSCLYSFVLIVSVHKTIKCFIIGHDHLVFLPRLIKGGVACVSSVILNH